MFLREEKLKFRRSEIDQKAEIWRSPIALYLMLLVPIILPAVHGDFSDQVMCYSRANHVPRLLMVA